MQASAGGSRRRIGIFQANWPLQVHTTNVVEELTRRGYAVDLFVYGVSQDFATLGPALGNSSVNVFDLSGPAAAPSTPSASSAAVPDDPTRSSPTRSVAPTARQHRWLRPARTTVHWLRKQREIAKFHLRIDDLSYILPPELLADTERRMQGRSYTLLMGIEREGLLWAGEMARRLRVPSAYYSLELYTNDFPGMGGWRFIRLKRLERYYHGRTRATLVQDVPRAKILFEDNRVDQSRSTTHLVPVSLLGPARPAKSSYLHEKLGLPRGTKIILVLGQVHAKRYTHEAVAAAQDFPADWTLVVHGPAYGDATLMAELTRLNTAGRARISTDLIPESELGDLVASADIGIALYSPDTLNEYWTGRASEKVARYAQAGVPMIAFDYPSYREVFERFHCGRVISSFDQLRTQVGTILEDHDAYRAGAFNAYRDVYEFSKQFAPVMDWIDQL